MMHTMSSTSSGSAKKSTLSLMQSCAATQHGIANDNDIFFKELVWNSTGSPFLFATVTSEKREFRFYYEIEDFFCGCLCTDETSN